MFQQYTPNYWAESCSARRDGSPDSEGQGALAGVFENVADDCQGCWHHHRCTYG